MIRDEITANMATQMAVKLDGTIKAALDRHWGVWSTDDLKRRCTLVRIAGSPIETLCVDGKPILEIHPLEVETVRTEHGWTLRATQNYRNL